MKQQIKILTGEDAQTLQTNVQRYLDTGWELHGIVFMGDGIRMHQAVVKTTAKVAGRPYCLHLSCLQYPEKDGLYCELHDPLLTESAS